MKASEAAWISRLPPHVAFFLMRAKYFHHQSNTEKHLSNVECLVPRLVILDKRLKGVAIQLHKGANALSVVAVLVRIALNLVRNRSERIANE